jgi:hypothetical protein
MKDARRNEITSAISSLEEAKSIIETCASEERDAYDELSDEAKEEDKGLAMDAAASLLEDAVDTIDTLINKLNDAKV